MARTKRSYTETERLGIMLASLKNGVAQTSKALEVPEDTIYTWFSNAGGITEIRSFSESATAEALSSAERAIFEEVVKRAENLDDKELLTTFRAMIEALTEKQGVAAQAGAQAQASIIQVNVDGETLELRR